VVAVAVGTRRQRATLLAVLVGTAALPIASEALKAPTLGYVWQGRYSMALAMGVPIVAGWIIATSPRVPARTSFWLAAVLAVGAGVGLVVGQSAWLRRTIVGINHPYFSWITGKGWSPPLPAPLLGLATVVLAVAYAGWLIFLASDRLPSDRSLFDQPRSSASGRGRSRDRAPSDDGGGDDAGPGSPAAAARTG